MAALRKLGSLTPSVLVYLFTISDVLALLIVCSYRALCLVISFKRKYPSGIQVALPAKNMKVLVLDEKGIPVNIQMCLRLY